MPAKTNSKHPQHIATESSKVAAEIEQLLADYKIHHRDLEICFGDAVAEAHVVNQLTALLMRHKNDQAYTSYRLGFADAKAGKEMTDQEAYDQLPEGHGARG